MSNISKYPLVDGFETTLSQERDGSTGTINVNDTPGFTFPAGVTTYIIINPDNDKIQLAEINAYDAGAKTITINNVTLEKGASLNYSAKTHSIGSVVRLSNNYEFWKDVVSSISSKLDSDADRSWSAGVDYAGMVGKPLTETQRDALTPVNGMIILNTTSGVLNQYIGGAWASFATGTTANASETVAGKVEIATDAQFTAGTATGETGAELVSTPVQSKKSISLKNSVSTTADTDEFVVNQGGEDKRITQLLIRDQLAASATQRGFIEIATDAEAATGTDESRAVNSKQLIYGGFIPSAGTEVTVARLTGDRSSPSSTYNQQCIGTILKTGVYTVYFELSYSRSGGPSVGYGRIYKNGVAFGTERVTGNEFPSYQGFTETPLSFSAGDTISLWVRAGIDGQNTHAKNLKVTCDQIQFTIS